jgi:hypothetical protein
MNTYLEALKGATVQSCQIDAGSVILGFDSQRLVVHNRWEVRGADGSKADQSVLVGTVVTDLAASDTVLRVEFGPNVLNVDFSESAWSGPEAAVFYKDGRPVVAWT